MIIKYFDLKKNLNKNFLFFLLYGPNIGHIEEIINNIIKPSSTKNVFNYDENEILSNTDNFEQSITSKSFFENEKLIIINRASDKILNIIESIFEKNLPDTTFILKSGNLEKKSKLRNFFEKKKNIICVPFYDDNYNSLLTNATNFFREKNLKVSPETINLIIERSNKDRINLKNELEKISYFALNKKSINYEDINKLTNLSSNFQISELTDHCLTKNKVKTINILNENVSSIEDNIVILKSFLYKIKRLKIIKEKLEEKQNLDSVISAYKPPIFWKDKEIIKQQIKKYSLKDLNYLISQINDLEILIKKNSQISNLIVHNFILENLISVNN
tara:strand:+ start:9614 stop:10609 length:996 start_codon:yes stop_codon:yes gene_type:complete